MNKEMLNKELKKIEKKGDGNLDALLKENSDELDSLREMLIEMIKTCEISEVKEMIVHDGKNQEFFKSFEKTLVFRKNLFDSSEILNAIQFEHFIEFLDDVFENGIVYESNHVNEEILKKYDLNKECFESCLVPIKIITDKYITSFIQREELSSILANMLGLDAAKLNLVFQKAEAYNQILTSKYMFDKIAELQNKISKLSLQMK